MIPQIIYIVLISINLLFAAHYHGRPRENYNFGVILISTIISTGLLYWGGFFDVMRN